MNIFAVLFGVPVWGFAVLWIALATQLTVRTMRRGMPFALTWWSLTFPVGTFVTGTTQLANHTGLPAFRVAAAIAYVGLLGTWGWWRCGRRAAARRKPVRTAADGRADQGGQGPAPEVAPCCRRVGGSDDNTELSRVSTAAADALHAGGTGWSGLENGRDALPTGRADRDQPAYRLPVSCFFSASCLASCATIRPPVAANG